VPAVDAALTEGAHGVEIDVRLSADGVPVCCHDATLLRTAGTDIPIAAASYAELRRVRVSGAAAAPGLRDMVETVADRGRLIVEVKRGGEPRGATARAVGRLLTAVRPGNVVVSSFDPGSLRVLQAEHPSLPTALVTRAADTSIDNLDLASRIGCVEVHPQQTAAGRVFVQAARQRGLGVVPWTLTEPGELRRLAAGVDGAIVDSPLHTLASVGWSGPGSEARTHTGHRSPRARLRWPA
jgi:glycerophosphoryl diester phosphodiesterase